MKFGIMTLFDHHPALRPTERFYGEFLDQCARAEDLGFDSVWVSEHHFSNYGGICPSPQVFLAALTQRTRRVRLGTGIVLLPFHRPVTVAEEFAMLDVLSTGRVDLGLGRGWLPHEFEHFGISMDETRARLEEGIDVIRRAWTQERFSYTGRFTRVQDIEVLPRPLQKPYPPIWVAGLRTPETFDWIGEQGFHLQAVPYVLPSAGLLEQNIARYRHALAARGHTGQEIGLLYHLYVAETEQQARAEAEAALFQYLRQIRELASAPTWASKDYANYERGKQHRASLSFEALAERRVIVFGSPDQCIETIAWAQKTYGMTYFLGLTNYGALEHAKIVKSLELFARHVMPAFRD
jgi:natural product biosynthesis luciferase-like monooxygenase protein